LSRTARSIGASIFTEADTVEELRAGIREAVACHFEDPTERPKVIRLHFVRDEVIAL
jgi:predicted RNase H-like HicB family nuclease